MDGDVHETSRANNEIIYLNNKYSVTIGIEEKFNDADMRVYKFRDVLLMTYNFCISPEVIYV